ncbi:hypothetical protein CU044_3214 [Streptomyces sp. L-9-10]|uniref:DUF6296 family protein n=1 Tax=unclassified Streptomyces TaxID=2593676 RepID=UPI00101CE353|nr:DUF6296 family protein [Streptomyces sp. L-9-10]RYJ27462.1 hypothetical protein CU044_3214 [Streptomyces sp. L-9-10]
MGISDTYTLVFAYPDAPVGDPDDPDDEDVVLVHRTDRLGPGGHALYADETGIVLAEISDQDEVRMVASGGHQDLKASVRARPV